MTLKRILLRSIIVCLFLVFLSLTLVYNRLSYFNVSREASTDKADLYNLVASEEQNLPHHPSQQQTITNKHIEQLENDITALRKKLDEMERLQNEYKLQSAKSNGQRFHRTKQLPYSEKKRILITGGAGFVGSHLLDRLLTDGHEVIVADNFYTGRRHNIEHWLGHPNFELLHHDIVNPLYVEVDEIYHLASPASPPHYMMNAVKTIKTNTVGTINMLGLAKRIGAKILVASTSEVYGDPIEHPQKETYWGHVNPIGPRSCYDEGKRVSESLTVAYKKQEKLDVRIARIFNTYGPRMHVNDGRVVSNFISQALQGQKLSIYGEGTQTRSFQFVSDLVEGLVRLMASNYTLPVNLGNPEEYTINQFATIVLGLLHEDGDDKLLRSDLALAQNSLPERYAPFVEYHPVPQDDPRRRRPDISLARRVLNWYPNVSLADGLGRTIDYFRGELRLSMGQKPMNSQQRQQMSQLGPYSGPNALLPTLHQRNHIPANAQNGLNVESSVKMNSVITTGGSMLLLPQRHATKTKEWDACLQCSTTTGSSCQYRLSWLTFCLLGTVVLNFILMGWILSALQLHKDPQPLRHLPTEQAQVHIDRTLSVEKTLYSQSIEAAYDQLKPVLVQSNDNHITFKHIDSASGLENSVRFGEGSVEVKTTKLSIKALDKRGTAVELSSNELTLDDDQLRHLRPSLGGLRVTEQLNTSEIRATNDHDFRIECRNENVKLTSDRTIEIEAMSGPVELDSLDMIELHGRELSIDSRNVQMAHLRQFAHQSHHGRHQSKMQEASPSQPVPIAYQLCICANGNLFAANADSICENDFTFCAKQ